MQTLNAMQRLNEVVHTRGPLMAGLAPNLKEVTFLMGQGKKPLTWQEKWRTLEEFCTTYLDCLQYEVGAVKINSAYFERMGFEGLYWDIAAYAKSNGYYVIGDVKRSAIGNTSQEYAEAFLSAESPFDAITINPYFGADGIKPFLKTAKENGKGVFILVKTDNSSSSEVQNMILQDGRRVYEHVAELVKAWGEYTSKGDEDYNLVGAVMGATNPEETAMMRALMPKTFFLVPRYGIQEITATDVALNFDKEGGGAIVNASRRLMYAVKNQRWNQMLSKEEWSQATMAEAEIAREELEEAIAKK